MTPPASDPAVLVTRMLAAADDGAMPFATFELTLQQAQDKLPSLAEVQFGTYAGDVTYSAQLRRGLDLALARDWVQIEGPLLRATTGGRQMLASEQAEPDQHERAIISRLAA